MPLVLSAGAILLLVLVVVILNSQSGGDDGGEAPAPAEQRQPAAPSRSASQATELKMARMEKQGAAQAAETEALKAQLAAVVAASGGGDAAALATTDANGIARGHCKECGADECPQYRRKGEENECNVCGCKPVKHVRR